jgi:signal transduction histidine kinase
VTAAALRHRPIGRADTLVAVGALAYAIAVAFAVPRSGALVTTYGRASELASALDLAAGLALLAAGVVAAWERAGGSLGPLCLAAGVVWLAPDWVGWEDGPPLARSLAMVIAPLLPALILHLALAAPRGRLSAAAPRVAVGAAYACTGFVALGRALVRDPFEDPHCWSNCLDNVFLVYADRELTETLDSLWARTALGAGVLLALASLWRLARATPTARRSLGPVLVPAALAGAAGAAYAIALLRIPVEDPEQATFAGSFLARAVTTIALAVGVAWLVGRSRRTRAAVARVAAERQAAATARPLREALALALEDPDLQVAYPLSGSGRTVDAAGEPLVLPAPGSGRTLTRISRGGECVALVAHDETLLDGGGLEREIGAAARLAVDNERLQAAVLAQLGDLRASRVRIVETGDAVRRQLERDLHDGAQQRLLALSFELRLARAAARADGDDVLEASLAVATGQAQAALDELRELAHGIYPAILGEAGLAAAIATLADTADLPVELGEVTPDRLPAAVETAAYLVLAAGVEDAARHGATHVELAAARSGSVLRVTVNGADGVPQHLSDRVGALGGRLEAGAGTVEAEIPCV